jgi:hypothetical protein
MGKIFISAGHFTGDSGASSILGTTEAQEMIMTRDLIVQELESRGLEFVSVPDTINLAPTISWINSRAVRGDVALEIHGNSVNNIPSANGTEAFFVNGNGQRKLDAEKLLAALITKVPGLRNRGAKPDNTSQHPRLAFCRDVSIPSVLMELCFLTNSNDMNLLTTQRQKFAEGIVDGLQAWSGQRSNPEPPPFATIKIKINDAIESQTGILVNDNSFIPIDLVENLGILTEQLRNFRRVSQGNIVYIKAVELEVFNISVGFDNSTQTVTLNTNPQMNLGQIDKIMRLGNTSSSQLADFLKQRNLDSLNGFLDLPQIYVEEALFEGVNHDIAFCQMCLETGFLHFGGDVKPEQNNFAGLGATGGGVAGASFPDIKTGVRAHIQHLKAYSSTAPIVMQPIVDPRFDLISRGIATTVNDLSGRWSTGRDYGEKIMSLVRQLYQMSGIL